MPAKRLFDANRALANAAASYVTLVAEQNLDRSNLQLAQSIWNDPMFWKSESLFKVMVKTYGLNETVQAIDLAEQTRRLVFGTED
jgi:hypothetical protein